MNFKIIFFFLLLCINFNSLAIINPEKVYLYENFQKEADNLISKIFKENNEFNAIIMYSEYNKYLEKELNSVYSKLLKEVDADNKKKLIASQKKWLLFRKSEIEFLESNWTINNFGTSSRLSKPSHIAEITRNRVDALLTYYIEY